MDKQTAMYIINLDNSIYKHRLYILEENPEPEILETLNKKINELLKAKIDLYDTTRQPHTNTKSGT